MNKKTFSMKWISSGILSEVLPAVLPVIILTSGVFLISCSSSNGGTTTGNPLVADTSPSGAVAGALGGAMSNTSSGGSVTLDLMPRNYSSSIATQDDVSTMSLTCPTYASTNAYCADSSSSMWLTYDSCKFSGSSVIWDGFQSLTMSTGTAACGTFPNPGANGVLYRQYVSASGSTTPSTMVLQNSVGDVYIDNHTADLSNFNSDSLATIKNSGYGVAVTYNSGGTRSSVTMGQRVLLTGSYDHTIYGTFSVSETTASTTRTLSGSISVYHNLLKVIGTSTFSGLVHDNTCCLPISGTITTAFSQGSVSPTIAGALMVGKSEVLTLTGCGTGTLVEYDGTTKDVSLNKCF